MLDPKLSAAVDDFAVAMKAKLLKKQDEGEVGWDGGDPIDLLEKGMVQYAQAGRPVDAANFAMMVWYRTAPGQGPPAAAGT